MQIPVAGQRPSPRWGAGIVMNSFVDTLYLMVGPHYCHQSSDMMCVTCGARCQSNERLFNLALRIVTVILAKVELGHATIAT